MQTSFKEEFKPINGFKSVKDNTYEVSNLGNIRRIGEKENKKVRKDKDGYIITSLLDRHSHARNQKIHRLVAYVFVENDNPDIKKQVNHKNEKKDDNRAENLEWCTARYNINYGSRTEKAINNRRKKIIIRNEHSGDTFTFSSLSEASRSLKIEESGLSRVLNGERKSVKGFTAWFAESAVYGVRAVPIELIDANTYNPNHVAPPEMKLLYQSIKSDTYTMPIVCYQKENGRYEIVDGYHRYTTMLNHKDIYEREHGVLPVSVIEKPIEDRMASTIRHNRARGSHDVNLMVNIVKELTESGMSDAWIIKNIGMDADELLRLKQISGLASLFQDKDYSQAWE